MYWTDSGLESRTKGFVSVSSHRMIVDRLGFSRLDETDRVEVHAGVLVLSDPVEMACAAAQGYAGSAGGVDEFLEC